MTLTSRLKEIAHRHGFDVVRIAEASPLVDAARTMHTRLASGHLDGMPWLTHERIDLATSPQQLLEGARAERQAKDKTDWQTMIADERAKRMAGIDEAAAEVQAAVDAEQKALEERQRAAEELQRQANGEAPAPPSANSAAAPDSQPLPMPPGAAPDPQS